MLPEVLIDPMCGKENYCELKALWAKSCVGFFYIQLQESLWLGACVALQWIYFLIIRS